MRINLLHYTFFFLLSILSTGCAKHTTVFNINKDWVSIPAENPGDKLKKYQDEIPGYFRPVESTYLTFPEWSIVYSSQEYAEYLKNHLPSGFPYFSSISQFWSGYSAINTITKRYPYNFGDHVMLNVIGSSFTLEYTFKGLYENTIGRTTELLSFNRQTAEDKYAQKVAQEYAEFIPLHPWYEFSFLKQLPGLWKPNTLIGYHMIRKYERKLFLSFEYSFKAVYATLIGLGTHSTYGAAAENVYGIVENTSKNFFQKTGMSETKKLKSNEFIVGIPRQQTFTDSLVKAAQTDVIFKDISGNEEILVTALAPKGWQYTFHEAQFLFTQEILTNPNLYRIAVRVPIRSLLIFISYLENTGVKVEHIYDY